VNINIIGNHQDDEDDSGVDFFNDSISCSQSQRSYSINYHVGKAVFGGDDSHEDVIVNVSSAALANKSGHQQSDFDVGNHFTHLSKVGGGDGSDIKESLLGKIRPAHTVVNVFHPPVRKTSKLSFLFCN